MYSISRGIVRDNKWQGLNFDTEAVLSDAPVNVGNSGGPLVKDDGRVVGFAILQNL